jgi:hypothetical protein
MSYWLENSMQFEQPDNLSRALLITDGITQGFDESRTSGFTLAFRMPQIFQTNNNINNINNSNNTTSVSRQEVDIKDLGLRCGYCCANVLLLVYAIALACSALDKILGLHIFPEATLVILVGTVLAVYLVIGLYAAMPMIVGFIEIIRYEYSVLAGTPP